MRAHLFLLPTLILILFLTNSAAVAHNPTMSQKKELQDPPGVVWIEGKFFPRFSNPDHLYVVDLRGADPEIQIMMVSLQGIVNRNKPSIYLIFDDFGELWLEEIEKLNVTTSRTDPFELIARYRDLLRGAVIYDPSIPDTLNVATTIAGLEDRLILDPSYVSLAQNYALNVLDLREQAKKLKWGNDEDGRLRIYEWVYQELWPRAEKRMIAVANPGPPVSRFNEPPSIGIRDYIVSLKLVTLYLSAKDPQQRSLLERFLSDAPSPIPVFGWYEDEEWDFMNLISKYGDWSPVLGIVHQPYEPSDLTVLSGIRPKLQKYAPRIGLDLLETLDSKVFVALYISDGDNLGFDTSLGWVNFWGIYRGMKMGWTVNPTLVDVAPVIWNYYVRTADERSLIASVSASGYFLPSAASSEKVSRYLDYAKRYWDETGLVTGQVMGWDDDKSELYWNYLKPFGFFSGYNVPRFQSAIPLIRRAETTGLFFYHPSAMPIVPNLFALNCENSDDIISSLTRPAESFSVEFPAYKMPGFGSVIYDESVHGNVRFASKGFSKSKAVVFGPYITLPPGEYRISYTIKTTTAAGDLALVDVATDLGKKIIARRTISSWELKPDTWKSFSLSFTLEKTTSRVEFRVFSQGISDLYVDKIRLEGFSKGRKQPVFTSVMITATEVWKCKSTPIKFYNKLSSISGIQILSGEELMLASNPHFMLELARDFSSKTQTDEKEANLLKQAERYLEREEYSKSLSTIREMLKASSTKVKISSNNGGKVCLDVKLKWIGKSCVKGSRILLKGIPVIVEAYPKKDYRFVRWEVEGLVSMDDPNSARTTVSINGPGEITAVFEPIASQITPKPVSPIPTKTQAGSLPQTTTPKPVPTASISTPIERPKSLTPGFEAIFALAGLIAAAYMLRK